MNSQTKQRGIMALAVVLLIVLSLGYSLNQLGVMSLHLPWSHAHKVQTTVAQAGPAEIVRIEPIELDCRARIVAKVPVKGVKIHHFIVDYRQDTVTATAQGDIDTCVRGGALIQELKNGGWLVEIEANQVVFNRPRIDLPATANSVRYNKGWIGKLTDAAPWVSSNNPVVTWTLAYAQMVVGSRSCMRAAWDPTVQAITTAYATQARHKHIDPHRVQVVINGIPDFGQHAHDLDHHKIHGYTFEVDARKIECILKPA